MVDERMIGSDGLRYHRRLKLMRDLEVMMIESRGIVSERLCESILLLDRGESRIIQVVLKRRGRRREGA
jgi:hypothetical protein